MQCPYCNNADTKVTDKRDGEGTTRRRRECLKCEKRFTTYERVEWDLTVIKKDGHHEKIDREKIARSITKALEKRPFTGEQINEIVSDIEASIRRSVKGKDIKSSQIGDIIMKKLKRVDKIGYIRFASVYREFADLDDFKDELKSLGGKK